MRIRGWHAIAVMAAVTAWGGAAALAADGTCVSPGDLKDRPALSLARVTGAPRTFFFRNAAEQAGCPSEAVRCRAKAFLVPGDRVVIGPGSGGFACASYATPRGQERVGWLPEASLAREPAPPVAAADWVGRWVRDEAVIAISLRGGKLHLAGEATYGTHDPDRVERGAVNVGEVEADIAPKGADLAFTQGSGGTLPIDGGDADSCKVWLRRLGPYLLVDDNLRCGGLNVSFAGTYARGR